MKDRYVVMTDDGNLFSVFATTKRKAIRDMKYFHRRYDYNFKIYKLAEVKRKGVWG